MKDRIEYIDQMKGFSILLVVIGHIYVFCIGNTSSVIFESLAIFHMPFFFMLSGFMTNKITDFFNLLKKKIVTLLFPFLFIGSIYSFLITGSIKSLWFNEIHLGYWFTWVLFWIFFIYYFLNSLLSKINIKDNAILEICYWGGLIIAFQLIKKNDIIPDQVSIIFSTKLIIGYFQYFIWGILLKRYSLLYNVILSNVSFSISLIIYVILLISMILFNNEINFLGYLIISLSSLNCTFFYVKKHCESIIASKYLIYMGKRSLDIYVLHYFFLNLFSLKNYSHIIMGQNLLIEVIIVLLCSSIIIFLSLSLSHILRTSTILSFFFLGDYSQIKGKDIFLRLKTFATSNVSR